MLKLLFGNIDEALYSGDFYFDYILDPLFINKDFSKRVIKAIDKGDVKGENCIVTEALGAIPPDMLSGGSKSLIILMYSDQIMNLSCMGDNCLPFLADIAQEKDITVCTDLFREIYENSKLGDVLVLNSNTVVHDVQGLYQEWKAWRKSINYGREV